MKVEKDWLKEMMDAALNDSPEALKDPDFRTIPAASLNTGRSTSRILPYHRRRIVITAAAAILAVSIALPIGIITGRKISTRKIIIEQNTLFVEELIGGTIFDEGLSSDNGESWLLDGNLDNGFLDI